MKNPFKVGDTVYHVIHGKRLVADMGAYSLLLEEAGWCVLATVSFSPWPKPDHARPIEDGWWVVNVTGRMNGKEYTVRRVQDGRVVYDGYSHTLSDYEFVTKVEIKK